MNKFSFVAALAALVAVGGATFRAPAQAAEMKPVVVVSVSGYDALKKDLQLVGELGEFPELAQTIDAFVSLLMQGLPGLDRTRPGGAAIVLSESLPPRPEKMAIFVPVTDADRLLESFAAYISTTDLGDDFIEIKAKQGPDKLVAKKVGKWLYLGENKSHLADLPDDPSTLLGDLPKRYAAAARVNIQNVPEPIIDGMLGELRRGAGLLRDGGPFGLTEAQREFATGLVQVIEDLVHDSESLTIGVGLDGASRSAHLEYEFVMKAGTGTASELNAAKSAMKPSRLAGLADPSWAANAHFNVPIFGDSEEEIAGLIADGRKALEEDIENIPDPQLRSMVKEIVGDVFDVAIATVKEGQLNLGAAFVGEGPFSVVVAAHTADAKKLEATIRKLLQVAKDQGADLDVSLDAGQHGDVAFHVVGVPPIPDESFTEQAKMVFGTDELKIALGFGKQTLMLAIGEDPVKAAGEALKKSSTAAADKLPIMQLQMKLGPILKAANKQAEDPALTMFLGALGNTSKDHITMTVDVVPNGERLRLQVEEGLLAAFGKMVKQQVQGGFR